MIIQCEKCQTKFNIDESKLKGQGSKVRCSLCKHTFVVYPPENGYFEDGETMVLSKEKIKKTTTQDLPDAFHEEEIESGSEDRDSEFDEPFDKSLEGRGENDAAPANSPTPPEADEKIDDGKPPEPAPIKEKPPQKKARKWHLLPILLVIVLILIGAAAAIFLWAPEIIPDSLSMLKPAKKQEISDMGVRRLSFQSVTGSFVASENSGNLFVIRGEITNDYPKSRSFILIKGSILDDKGQVVKRKLAYGGNNFKEEEIKSLPLEKINKAMKNRYGMGRNNVNVAPGAKIAFTIIFEDLPKNLSEFTVEAVSSSPGTK